MLQTFVIGLGHAGAGLHLPVLQRARARQLQEPHEPPHQPLFADGPLVACDPLVQDPRDGAPPGVIVAPSLTEGARLVEPRRTVVHVCTPPAVRAGLLGRLADLGFRMFVVEKPLAVTEHELARITRLVAQRGLRLAVVAQWLASSLTARLHDLVLGGTLGPLRSMSAAQHKARFRRTLDTPGHHPSAFDVEVPHAVGVAVRLAGTAEVSAAASTDLLVDGAMVPRMGSASLALQHATGVRTEIRSDLTSPVRTRRITLRFAGGIATGHYPVSRDDDVAQLLVTGDGPARHSVFRDDALTAFLLHAYRTFGSGSWSGAELGLHCEVVRLLCAARRMAREEPAAASPLLSPNSTTSGLPAGRTPMVSSSATVAGTTATAGTTTAAPTTAATPTVAPTTAPTVAGWRELAGHAW